MKILDAADFTTLDGNPLSEPPSDYCLNNRGEHYFIKRAKFYYLTPLREYGDPRNWRSEECDPAYANLSAVWEVCFSKFAKALMPKKVQGTALCRQGENLLVASKRELSFFGLRKYISISAVSEQGFSYVDFSDYPPPGVLNPQGVIRHYISGAAPKVTGLLEILIISGFLGDKDCLNHENVSLMFVGRKWQSRKIDFDSAGIFNEPWNVKVFLTELDPKTSRQLAFPDNLQFKLALGCSDFEKEQAATLNKLARFNLEKLEPIWNQYKPLLLKEAEKLSDPIIRARTIDYIKKDSPLISLKERQEQIQSFLANDTSVDSNLGFTALVESERRAFAKWQGRASKNPAARAL